MLRSGAIYFVGRAGAALIVLLSVAIYTRLLPPAEYGIYALVVSGSMMAYAGITQWLTFSLARFLPTYRDREDIVRSHVAIGYLAVAVLVLVAALLIAPFLPPDARWRWVLLLGLGLFLAMSFAELDLVVFQMMLAPSAHVRFTLLRIGVAAAIGVTLAYLGWGSVGLLLGLVLGNLCIIVPNLARHWGCVRRITLDRALLQALAAYGLPFAITGVLGALINVSDRYIIAALIGTDAAGLYAAPYDLATRSLHVLMMVVATAGHPMIFRAHEAEGRAAAEPLVRRLVELLLAVSLPVAIAFAMLGPAIANVLLGKAFQPSARELIPWIAVATILLGVQSIYLSLAFSLTKRPLRETGVLALGVVVNLLLNLALIPRLGLIGAALATVVAYALILVGSFLVGRRLYRLPFPGRGAAKIVVACVAWALVLWPVAGTTAVLPVLWHSALAGAVYLAILSGLDVAGTRAPTVQAWRRGGGEVRARLADLMGRRRDR